MSKRIFLFAITNILIVVTLSAVARVLGLDRYFLQHGFSYGGLIVFCLLWGFGGAFISLLISRWMAKMSMRVQVIDPHTDHPDLRWVVDTVHRYSQQAGLPAMPEVGIYESPDLNAFATGPSKRRSLVAVSTGLLRNMNQKEAEGVLAHEVAHIANGDMVTMTLIQGVVNAFVMFFARIIAIAASQFVREDMRAIAQFFIIIACEILLGILGMMVVAYFSRHREYRADEGGARLAGREAMVSALQRLQSFYDPQQPAEATAFSSLKISGKYSGLMALMATHPPLPKRIQALLNPGDSFSRAA